VKKGGQRNIPTGEYQQYYRGGILLPMLSHLQVKLSAQLK